MTLHGKSDSQLNSLYQLPPSPGSVLQLISHIVLREIPNPFICVHSYTVAWPRALGCLISFTNERTTEYRRWKGESTAAAAVGGKHDPSKVVFSPLSGTDNPTRQRKESAGKRNGTTTEGHHHTFTCHTGIAEEKVSSAALAECIGVWFHLSWARVCKRKRDEALSLIAL